MSLSNEELAAIRGRLSGIPRDNMSRSERDRVALVAEVDRLTGERDRLKRGGAQLGRIIDRYAEWVLDATDMHAAIDEDGDGDWELIWEKLAALRPERDQLQARLDKARALVADFNANGNSRELGDPVAQVWHQAAVKLFQALDGSDQ